MSDKHEQLTSGGESRTEAGSADWQRYLDAELGLRNHWYPAFFSRDLADGETRHESLLGERIYFKRVAGRVYAVENRCAHRGAPFSSRVECYTDETITCPVHGFTYDVRDGKLVKILSIDDSPLIGRVAVPSYPIEERFSIVWIYIGDGEPRSLREDVLPSLWNTPDLATRPTARARQGELADRDRKWLRPWSSLRAPQLGCRGTLRRRYAHRLGTQEPQRNRQRRDACRACRDAGTEFGYDLGERNRRCTSAFAAGRSAQPTAARGNALSGGVWTLSTLWLGCAEFPAARVFPLGMVCAHRRRASHVYHYARCQRADGC